MPNPVPIFIPGPRLIDGSDLNKLVDILNADVTGLRVGFQATPVAMTVSALMTSAALIGGLITGAQGAGAAAAYQLPTVAALVAALPSDFANNQTFNFVISNISTNALEIITVTTNTGWTLVGNMVIPANAAPGTPGSVASFRVRRVSATAFTLYRIS
jgi:hypothetical protein